MMIKIVHITTVHSSLDSRIFYKECLTLVKAGYDITLIAQHKKNETVDGVKIIALPKTNNRILRMFVLTLKALWLALKQKADVYHLHDPELMFVGVLLKLFKNKKIIYDVHEDFSKQIFSKQYIPNLLGRIIAIFIKITEISCSKFFDGIITATDNILKNFSHHTRTISVKNFPIISKFSDIKGGEGNENDVFNIVYIGGIFEARGINQIIQALEFINSNKQVKLTLAGKFFSLKYEKKIRRLERFKKVKYTAWIEYEKIPELLSSFDAGIVCLQPISNYLTALPIKLFEYMAAGLPVISSDFPLWKNIVDSNGCGICVNPLEPEEIAKAIEYLIEHPKNRKKMGENGRQAILKKYNWEKEAEKLTIFYRSLLER